VKLGPQNPLVQYPRRDRSQDPRNLLVHSEMTFPSWYYQAMQPGILATLCAECSVRLILCNLSLVGTMSWMTTQHIALMVSEAQIACGLVHTLAQSAVGCLNTILISRDVVPASLKARSVSYILRRHPLFPSPSIGGSTCAMSKAYLRKYSNVWYPRVLRGFALYVCSSQYFCHATDTDPACLLLPHSDEQERSTFRLYVHQSPSPFLFL
jgi:hypothetical protein